MNLNNITLQNLFSKALQLPSDTFIELYVNVDGEITFSAPLTGNSYTTKRKGIINKIYWNDFKGTYLRSDSKIEFEGLGNENGEKYKACKICNQTEAIKILICIASVEPHELFILFNKIKNRGSILAYC